jgi:hypothetical protein
VQGPPPARVRAPVGAREPAVVQELPSQVQAPVGARAQEPAVVQVPARKPALSDQRTSRRLRLSDRPKWSKPPQTLSCQ